MEILTPFDVQLLKLGAVAASAYAIRSTASRYTYKTPSKPDLPLLKAGKSAQAVALPPTRSILKSLGQSSRQCMVFYGSQTGTAERYAHRFAREALERYGQGCVIADLDDYDFVDLAQLSDKHLLVFILATYGEGEPTDNAVAFHDFISGDNMPNNLPALSYSAFGLGSSKYTLFNAAVRHLDQQLSSRGAQRIGSTGLGDDGKGTLDEDFSEWLDMTLPSIASYSKLGEIPRVHRPAFEVKETTEIDDRHVFLGEANKAQLYGRLNGPFIAQNPLPSRIVHTRELFSSQDRNCVHMEFDVSGTTVSYDTGDHLAVQPENSDIQVDLFLKMFGLSSRRHIVVQVQGTDPQVKPPIPQYTTYEAAVRYYLDICGAITRGAMEKLSEFAINDLVREGLQELASNKILFMAEVTQKQLTIAELLLAVSRTPEPAVDAPFSLLLELLPKLKPRHYSISSSSLASRKTISITAVVNAREASSDCTGFRGVSTGYLHALKNNHLGSGPATHALQKQRQPTSDPRPLIYVRRSRFRPPFDPSTPIIMIGPGTGVAPFRAFVQERAYQRAQRRTIGRSLLFYGCRSSSEDFLYKGEWQDIKERESLGKGAFEMFTAFSREGGKPKQYVQDLLAQVEIAREIKDLVSNRGAQIYICGDAARMAKDVTRVLGAVLGDKVMGTDCVESLKSEGRWFEDVW